MKKKYASLIREGVLAANAVIDLSIVVANLKLSESDYRTLLKVTSRVMYWAVPKHPLTRRAYYRAFDSAASKLRDKMRRMKKPQGNPYIGKPVPPKPDITVSKPRISKGFHE